VSRYKLDEFLQLFDFPSPNISAEQRYATNVPLQRLFFMNSDFVQQQAELVVRRIEAEPTVEARIQKAYRIVFGRAATPEEVRLGVDYLRNEPLKEYEERKKAQEEKEKKKAEKKEMTDGPGEAQPVTPGVGADLPNGTAMDPEGMMSGVVPAAARSDAKKPLLPGTHWGRYVKILLSSTEFLFIN